MDTTLVRGRHPAAWGVPPTSSASSGLPVTVTASLKVTDAVTLSPMA